MSDAKRGAMERRAQSKVVWRVDEFAGPFPGTASGWWDEELGPARRLHTEPEAEEEG